MSQQELTALKAELSKEKQYSAQLGAEVERLTGKLLELHTIFGPLFEKGKKAGAAKIEDEYEDWKCGRLDLYRSHGRF